MSEKYTMPSLISSVPRVITSDIWCAACLLSLGCTLCRVIRNDRNRVAFVFTGEQVHSLKHAYIEAEPLLVDAHQFKNAVTKIRELMNNTLIQRSAPCPQIPTLPAERSLKQLSPV